MMAHPHRRVLREATSGWTAAQALVVRRTLRDLLEQLDAAVVVLLVRDVVIDYVGDIEASPRVLARCDVASSPTTTLMTTRDRERRLVLSARVRPGFGSPSFLLLTSDPSPTEMIALSDLLLPVVEQLEDHLLEAGWSSRVGR